MQAGSNNASTATMLTLLFPFAGIVYTLNHWWESWAKNTFWLACIYLGAVFIYWPEGTLFGEGADGGRYAMSLIKMYNSSITVNNILGQYLINENTMDLYQQLMTFFISRFTDNGHVLFAAFAFVFGFFYSRNIWYILEKLPNERLGYLFILVTLYFLVCPITQINGVRMWTALHVFVYAMMPYLLEYDRSKLWWLFITPLIHFSYLYVALLAIAYVFLPYKIKTQNSFFITIAYIVFFISLMVNSINLSSVSSMLAEYSPEAYEGRINGYVNQDLADRNAAALALGNWYVAGSGIIKGWCYNILLLLLYPCLKRNFDYNDSLWNLYVFTLLFGAFANVGSLIPAGGRFQLVAQMFKVPLILIVAMDIPFQDRFKGYLNIALVLLLIPFVFDIRCLFDYFSITAVAGNFFTLFFWENNVPLITYIKELL